MTLSGENIQSQTLIMPGRHIKRVNMTRSWVGIQPFTATDSPLSSVLKAVPSSPRLCEPMRVWYSLARAPCIGERSSQRGVLILGHFPGSAPLADVPLEAPGWLRRWWWWCKQRQSGLLLQTYPLIRHCVLRVEVRGRGFGGCGAGE